MSHPVTSDVRNFSFNGLPTLRKISSRTVARVMPANTGLSKRASLSGGVGGWELGLELSKDLQLELTGAGQGQMGDVGRKETCHGMEA
jgi:hypothetical protein